MLGIIGQGPQMLGFEIHHSKSLQVTTKAVKAFFSPSYWFL